MTMTGCDYDDDNRDEYDLDDSYWQDYYDTGHHREDATTTITSIINTRRPLNNSPLHHFIPSRAKVSS